MKFSKALNVTQAATQKLEYFNVHQYRSSFARRSLQADRQLFRPNDKKR